MDKKYDTSSPKRKAPRSNRGGCARKCHVPESMWHFFDWRKKTTTDCRQKAILPRRGRIALSANERIAEFLDFAIQSKFVYVNKLYHQLC